MNGHPRKTRIDASGRNPLIGDNTGDTVNNAASALAFIARHHADRAEWGIRVLCGETTGPDPLTCNEDRGLGLLCKTIEAALRFEAEGWEEGEI